MVGRTFSTTASLSLICGSTAIMKPSAAMFGVVVNDAWTTVLPAPPPAMVIGCAEGVTVK
jgi:hypothetical protein